jgi:molybdopterin converting factor small subunit
MGSFQGFSVMSTAASVRIELFGVPRVRAGRAELSVEADTVADAIAALVRTCPELAGGVIDQGRLAPAYRVSLNGTRFVTDTATRLAAGDSLILVAADAGG